MLNEKTWYTINDLMKLAKEGDVPFKSRNSWLALINAGKLKAIRNGNDNKFTYSIQGIDVVECLNGIKVSGNKES